MLIEGKIGPKNSSEGDSGIQSLVFCSCTPEGMQKKIYCHQEMPNLSDTPNELIELIVKQFFYRRKSTAKKWLCMQRLPLEPSLSLVGTIKVEFN